MPTAWVHRLIMSVPVALLPSVGSWYQANIDANDDLSTWPGLNATGSPDDPVTHVWACTAYTEPLGRAIIGKVCQLAGVPMPSLPQWNGWTKVQKYVWLSSVRNTFFQQQGIWMDLCDNEGDWDDADQSLAGVGLKRIVAIPGSAQ